jgi:hypothetical protein
MESVGSESHPTLNPLHGCICVTAPPIQECPGVAVYWGLLRESNFPRRLRHNPSVLPGERRDPDLTPMGGSRVATIFSTQSGQDEPCPTPFREATIKVLVKLPGTRRGSTDFEHPAATEIRDMIARWRRQRRTLSAIRTQPDSVTFGHFIGSGHPRAGGAWNINGTCWRAQHH